jgi:hypothetical protein
VKQKCQLIPVRQIPALIESWYGWRPHFTSVWRWTQGVRGGQVRLKTIKRFGRRFTSRVALRTFMREWEQLGDQQRVASRQAAAALKTGYDRHLQRDHERAIAELRKMGLKV